MALADRIRAARETWATVEGFDFLIRVPTMLQQVKFRDLDNEDYIRETVVGWRKVREIDVVPGGDASDAPFETDALIEWATDRPTLWLALVTEVRDAIRRRAERMADSEKRSHGSGGDVVPQELRAEPGQQHDAKRPGGGRGARSVGADGQGAAMGGG